jgi:hypothetical protein
MYSSKSFANIGAFLSNVPGTNSPIGELTTYAETFSREVGVYQDASQPGYTIYNFTSVNDGNDGPAAGKVAVDSTLVTKMVGLINYITNQITGTVGQIDADQLLTLVVAYGATVGLDTISLGPVVQHDQYWAPDWVSFQSQSLTTGGATPTLIPNLNTIWISIGAFVSEYDDYEIVVVPPIDNLDLFFGTGASVVNMVQAISTPQIISRMQTYSNGQPPTISRDDQYLYINPLNTAQTVEVDWPVLIYGPAGDNIDAIKDTLITYILAHSQHSRADWTTIFPDIFKRTEFIIAPHWQNYAIPNRTQANGVYSPIQNYNAGKNYLKQIAPAYDTTFVDTHANVLSHPYNSLLLSTVGSVDNRGGMFEIGQVFSDYIDVASTSLDFNRMTPLTQGFALMLSNMLVIAETMNENTTLPQGLMKVTRNGILYLVQAYNNIQYLVATKRSVYSLLGLTY